MCGRFNVTDDSLTKALCEALGINLSTIPNNNVCPSEQVATISVLHDSMVQINAAWGIKPSWAKKLLINAQAETVATKKTFRSAFELNRCVIPFSGWYEWKTENGRKQKYLFSDGKNPLFMAGILLEGKDKLVTLTTEASAQCYPIHHRMPLLIPSESIGQWLQDDHVSVGALLSNQPQTFEINKV